jgi:hypothetical protein
MGVLTDKEKDLFFNIIKKYCKDTHHERRNFLVGAGLSEFCDTLHLGSSKDEFAKELFARLQEGTVIDNGEEKYFAILFLEHLLRTQQDLDDKEKKFLPICIAKFNQSTLQKSALNKRQIYAMVDETRRAFADQSVTGNYRIDRSVYLNYDLNEIKFELLNKPPRKGVFAFALGGYNNAYNFWKDYVIESILSELREKVKIRCDKPIDLKVSTPLDLDDLEKQLLKNLNCQQLSDLLGKLKNSDVILLIWNLDIPFTDTNRIATSFWNRISEQVAHVFKDERRSFIIFWINLYEGQWKLDNYCCLPILEKFNLDDLKDYFERSFEDIGMAQEDVKKCVRRLEKKEGHIVKTFWEWQNILNELQGEVKNL